MKKAYEKPALLRAAALSKIAALDACPSGYIDASIFNGSGCVPEDEVDNPEE